MKRNRIENTLNRTNCWELINRLTIRLYAKLEMGPKLGVNLTVIHALYPTLGRVMQRLLCRYRKLRLDEQPENHALLSLQLASY